MYTLISLSQLSLLVGCTEPVAETPVHLVEKTLGEPTTLRAIANTTSGGLMVEVVDANGFAIPNQPVTFTVNGTTIEETSDAFGVAIANLDGNLNTGTATWNDQTVSVQGSLQTSLPEIVGYQSWLVPSIEESFTLTESKDGALYAYGNELWWVSESMGALAQLVGRTDSPVLGLDSGHIDGDGVLDALAYTSTAVYVLRGRPYGGFSLLSIYAVNTPYETHGFVGATINQLNDDAHGDIALASSNDKQTLISVLDGDGSWAFKSREPLTQEFSTMSMVAADENNDDFADITIIDSDGIVRRFSYSIEGWIGGFPSIIDPASFVSLSGAELAKPTDLNGDGNQDTLIFDGEGASTQDLVFFTIGETITKYSQSYPPYYSDTFDVDGNGAEDIFSLSSQFLHLTYLDEGTGAFAVRNLNTIPMLGALQVRDFDKDGWADFNVLGQHPTRVQGMLGESEKWTPMPIRWEEDDGIKIVDNLWAIGQIDSTDAVEVGAIIDTNGGKALKVWRYNDDFTSLTAVSSFDLGNSVVSDLQLCNEDFFVIHDNGTDKVLRQLQVDGSSISTKRRADVEQDYVECTTINGLNHFLVWGNTDTYTVLQQNLVSIDAGDDNGWNDADIGSLDNGQTHTVRGCTDRDCQVEYADLNNDGTDELIIQNSSGVTISGLGNDDITLSQTGVITTDDIDDNGHQEMIITQDDGWVWIFHAVGQHWSATQGVWMSEAPNGYTALADVNQDGSLEVIRPSNTGTLLTAKEFTPQ